MAWYHRSRERPNRMPDGKLAPAPTAEKQETKLAEAEEFKPAPIAISTNLPATVEAKGGKPKPEQERAAQAWNFPAAHRLANPNPAPAPQTKPAQSTSKPAPKPKAKTMWGSLLGWGKSAEEELEKDLAEDIEKEKQAQAKPAPKKYYEQPQPEKKPEAKPKQETAVADKFKPAPIAMSTNLPAPAPAKPAPAAKPAAKPVAVVTPAAHSKTRLTPEEIEALKAKEAALEYKVSSTQRTFRALRQSDEDKAREKYPAYAKCQTASIEGMVAMAEERADAAAASSYRRMIIDIRRDEPPAKPAGKPTLDEYLKNPKRYGPTIAPKSSYKPTAADVAKQPFQAPKPICNTLGRYLAAENCQTCRAMADWVHCPCNCKHHIPIDPNYDPHAGQASPSFKGGNPKGGFNSSRFG